MRMRLLSACLVLALTWVPAAFASSYYLWDDWGGTYADAEKSFANTEDDLMCWAAAASNVLEWTGWGLVDGVTTSDEMFKYFQDHWTDVGGTMAYGWDWWFDGEYSGPTESDWSQPDVPGGGFYPALDFDDYFHYDNTEAAAMAAIDAFLRAGWGTALGVYWDDGGHAITCWGYEYGTTEQDYLGIYVTDSDDSKTSAAPPDKLTYYGVVLKDGRWYLQDFYGHNDIYIGTVQAMEPRTAPALIPEPVTLLAAFVGAGVLAGYVRKRLGR
jgi:hypothetical protein